LGAMLVVKNRTAPSPSAKLAPLGCTLQKPPTVGTGFAGATKVPSGVNSSSVSSDGSAHGKVVRPPSPLMIGQPVLRSVARVPDIQPRSPGSTTFSPRKMVCDSPSLKS